MPKNRRITNDSIADSVKKFVVSAAVVTAFVGYALTEHVNASNGSTTAQSSTANQDSTNPSANVMQPTNSPQGTYRDGQYTGNVENAYYGNVQVKAIIQGGKITDIQWLDYPRDRRTSQMINAQATPWLKQEAIQVQSAQVDFISGATLTSNAFVQSLQSALNQAQS
jgi:uncharacterized protein with FMN-binding domain